MGKVRRCDRRCHNARKPRCRCWCGGFFHGANGAGAANREALAFALDNPRAAALNILEQHGFKEGETAYIEQKKLLIGS